MDHSVCNDLWARLARSPFRSRFRLGPTERAYWQAKGAPVIRDHALDFIAKRLAAAVPVNDGKQTPMRGHPVFIAQHATACCCRSCLEKWHGVPQGRVLSAEEQSYVADIIMTWLEKMEETPR